MSEYNIKVGVTLQFDAEREKDIIDKIENLVGRRKISEFISNMIRVVFDNPAILRMVETKTSEYGLTDEREIFFKGLESEAYKMKNKIDTIYDMAMKVYMLALFGKRLGIEKKADNLIQAQFVLQNQLDELCRILGISNTGFIYESNKLDTLKTKADEVMEYIIDVYDNIISEIKTNILIDNTMKYSSSEQKKFESSDDQNKISNDNTNKFTNSKETDSTIKIKQIDKRVKQEVNRGTDQNKSSEVLYNNEGISEDDDEIIDFGAGADFEALSKFVGF